MAPVCAPPAGVKAESSFFRPFRYTVSATKMQGCTGVHPYNPRAIFLYQFLFLSDRKFFNPKYLSMKKLITSLLMLAAAAAWTSAWADPAEVTHPKKDKDSNPNAYYTVGDEGTIYHSMDYPKNAPYNYCGWVTFVPANEGDPLNIEFTEFTVTSTDQTGPFVYIYDDDTILKSKFTSYSDPAPEGYIAAITAENASAMVTSTTGKLAVLYAPKANKSGYTAVTGTYTAKVTSAPPTDMVFQEATLESAAGLISRGMTDVPLATITVKTKGSLNPLTLDALSLDLSALTASGLVSNLRIYDTAIDEANLLTTLADGATTLTASGVTLKGTSKFILAADASASGYGTIPAPTLSALTIGGTSYDADASALTALELSNAILMPDGGKHATFTIDADTKFYDAGGPDGNIPLNAEGTLTLVPATAGTIIKFDPASWKLFDTSSVGYNDIFRAYSGREVADDALIADLCAKGRILYSTAADGSMTIYFKSVQGNASSAKAGWEATLSAITPTDMTVGYITALTSQPAKPGAGDKVDNLLLFDVRAENTLNPLDLTALNFALPEGAKAATSITVSYLGSEADSKTSTPYGTAEIGADGTATVSGSLTLKEGSNIFAVAATVAGTANNGDIAGIRLTGITASGKTTPAEGVEATVEVENVCRLTEGEHSHTIYGPWQFTHTTASEYSSKYAASTSDHTVTFTPAEAGTVAQLTFKDFNVYYSATSYGTKAKFEVYSGTGANRTLLWSLTDPNKAAEGPGMKLRSTAADGSLTVVFNPNTSSSYYTANGWHATVEPFTDHAATVSAIEVAQASTDIVGPGTADAELIKFSVETEGTISPLTLNGINLTVKGKEALDKVKVYTTTDGTMANATLWGSAEMPAEGNALTVAPAEESALQPLPEAKTRFIIAADVKSVVDSDIAVDAAVSSLKFTDGSTYTVENGDPEGERLTKNIYILGADATQTVMVGSPIAFYDNGGPDGKSSPVECTVTFIPTDPEAKLVLDTQAFSIGGGKIHVFSGREVNEENRLGKATGYFTTTGPAELTSKAADGSLTLQIKLIGTTLDGFAMTVTPVPGVAIHVADVALTAASEVAATRGTTDTPVGHAVFSVEGNKNILSISGVKASVAGSTSIADITSVGVAYTSRLDRFNSTSMVGKAAPAADGTVEITFDQPVEIDEAGDYHFWLTGDFTATAEPGNIVEIALTDVTTSATEPVEIAEGTKAARSLKAGMAGSYRIGASDQADFATFALATEALEGGIQGSVIFLVESGTYAENIVIENVEGTSQENPLIFISQSGNAADVVITGKSYASSNDDMVRVVNTPWVAFRNITFAPTSSGYGNAIHFHNSSRHCTVENCVITSETLNSSTAKSGTNLIRTSAMSVDETPDKNYESVANTECDYLTIRNNTLSGGYISLYLSAAGYVGMPKATGMLVEGNTISEYCSKGIYLADQADFTVKGNTVTKTDLNKGSIYAMDVYRAEGEFSIEGNKLSTTFVNGVGASVSTSVIYMRGTSGHGGRDAAHKARIVNNSIALLGGAHYTNYGLFLANAGSTANAYGNMIIAHNSILVKSASPTARGGYALFINRSSEGCGLEVRNNLLQAVSASSPLNIWNDAELTNIAFSGNAFYGGSGNVDNQSTPHTMETYREASGDQTSVWKQVEFLSDNDLRLAEADGLAMDRVDGVDTDLEGTERGTTTTAGAYEFKQIVSETPVIAEGYPKMVKTADTSATVATRWSVGAQVYAMAVKADAEAPTAEQLKAQRPTACEADMEITTTFNFLDQLTAYRAYFLAVEPLGGESEIATVDFTTLETIEELTAEIMWQEEPFQAGEQIELYAVAEGGKEPYTYTWSDQTGTVDSDADIYSEAATRSRSYTLKVTSADGQTAYAKANVPVVTQNLAIATFEDLPLEPESSWMMDEHATEDTYTDAFFSGSMQFGNFPLVNWSAWSGYGFANETSTTFTDYKTSQMRNCVGGGAEGTTNYGVGYLYEGTNGSIAINVPETGVAVPGMYVTNSAWTIDYILHGSQGFGSAFADGDYLELVVEGMLGTTSTGNVRVALADYRAAAATAAEGTETEPSKFLTEWKWVDLSGLGNIDKLKLSITGSANQITKVPNYVCIDQIGAADPSGVGSAKSDTFDGGIRILLPTPRTLTVTGVDGAYTLRLYSVDGICRDTHKLEGASTVSIDRLAPGTYVAEVTTADGGRHTVRILKK